MDLLFYRCPMSTTLYAASVPLFQQMLGGLKAVLAKAEYTGRVEGDNFR